MKFCPTCANLLLLEEASNGLRYFCETCPYIMDIRGREVTSVRLSRKDVDDIMGGAAAWESAQQTKETCPKCGHGKAYFYEMQTRSADEPMTQFFRCIECAHQWKN
ncbi:MAG: hypothetical protein MHM6MM_005526 [Cercozoa sp. M6MM]